MADNSKIEWTDATWNPITGCSVHSPGCTNCYAMKLAGTRLRYHWSREGLTVDTKAGPVWTGDVRFNEEWLDQPLRWKRPRMIFVCAHADLFHEKVADDWIDKIFAVMALCPQHKFQVLTKRADRMREYLAAFEDRPAQFGQALAMVVRKAKLPMMTGLNVIDDMALPLPNVWLGVSVEDQDRADERIPHLLATPAAVRWLSCEPLLGPVDLSEVCNGHYFQNPLTGHRYHDAPEGVSAAWDMAGAKIDWVVVGGESGDGARKMLPAWVRSLRDQCDRAGVAFHFKQWGAWAPLLKARDPDTLYLTTKKNAGRELDGVTHDGMPSAT